MRVSSWLLSVCPVYPPFQHGIGKTFMYQFQHWHMLGPLIAGATCKALSELHDACLLRGNLLWRLSLRFDETVLHGPYR